MKKILSINRINKDSKIIILVLLFLAVSFMIQGSTSGNAGIFANLVKFLTDMNTGLRIVFSLGAVGCIGFGLFKMLTDPNMGAIITLLIGIAIVLALIFGAGDVVTGLGGTMLHDSLGGL